ncbi:MAG TPA: acyltransferase [Mucilaginibacter sp.]
MAKRSTTIDSIRGMAILLIVVHHTSLQNSTVRANGIPAWIAMGLQLFVTGGWIAVDLFFVLSGFLVSGLLFQEFQASGKIKIGRFLVRRGFKIYPGFFIFLAISLLCSIITYQFFGTEKPYFRGYIKDAFFLHNYCGGIYVTTWSLDVEEAFYFLLPIFLYTAVRFRLISLQTMVASYAILLVLGILGRWIAITHYPVYNFDKQYSQTHYRLDGLFFGVLLSYIYNYHKSFLSRVLSKYKRLLYPSCIVLLIPNFIFSRTGNDWIAVIMLAINPVSFGTLLMLAIDQPVPIFSNCKWLAVIGVNSYAIYLWHPFVNGKLVALLQPELSCQKFVAYLLAYIALSILIGILATKAIEKPLLHFRDRHFKSQSEPLA